jgi:tRNA pseudouridine32 synthase/23S rRNA pseudouridine746 synthase
MLSDHILFIDAEAMVIDKPAGLPVDQPRDGSLSVENHLESLRMGFQRRPLPVHRLDRDTSGCLLLARNPKSHKRFAAAFEAGTVEKLYRAILAGIPDAEEGEIDLALGKVSTAATGWRMVPDSRGKAALTRWRVERVIDGRALVAFRPATGRTHQLRVHAASGLGIPILGDPIYGVAGSARRTMLHAAAITMPRERHAPIAAEAPLPADFGAFAGG